MERVKNQFLPYEVLVLVDYFKQNQKKGPNSLKMQNISIIDRKHRERYNLNQHSNANRIFNHSKIHYITAK
uniref:40S ribosomal protein S27 n=1 Tax=Rhizophora mucronata TaxID=61149 RepID=A0A2P2KBH6_RHIMU